LGSLTPDYLRAATFFCGDITNIEWSSDCDQTPQNGCDTEMAAASDKARFFLEQSVPELKEYERKKIFSRAEISSIARQRSGFEHKINARGSTPADFARYAEFEINVEALRKKRVQRLGIRSVTHTGQKRIFFVFDRGTKKHSGDVGLWLQNIEFARKQKAHKKLSQIFTNVLRLHPTRSEIWIFAAQFAMEEHGDMTEARGYMQRGLRFCKNKSTMWIQYARLEMSYIAKIHARRQILGIDEQNANQTQAHLPEVEDEVDVAAIAVPDLEPPQEEKTADTELRKLESVPAQGGAMPIAIFDAAFSHFNNDPDVARTFVEMLSDYSEVPATPKILCHIREDLRKKQSKHWIVDACDIQLSVLGIPAKSAEFPGAFREALKRLKQVRVKSDSEDLDAWARQWLRGVSEEQDLDPALQTVAKAVIRSIEAT
jgi:U3 small nucleolar RNA-associated protein 6